MTADIPLPTKQQQVIPTYLVCMYCIFKEPQPFHGTAISSWGQHDPRPVIGSENILETCCQAGCKDYWATVGIIRYFEVHSRQQTCPWHLFHGCIYSSRLLIGWEALGGTFASASGPFCFFVRWVGASFNQRSCTTLRALNLPSSRGLGISLKQQPYSALSTNTNSTQLTLLQPWYHIHLISLVAAGLVGYPRACSNQFREFNSHRAHIRAGIFSCIKN